MAEIRTLSNSRRPLQNEIRRVNLVRCQYSPVHFDNMHAAIYLNHAAIITQIAINVE